EILSGMNFILSISSGVIKLTGPAGTGKSRLLQELRRELQGEKQDLVLFANPPKSPEDLQEQIRRQLKLDRNLAFAKALSLAILAKPYDQQRLVVAFDDAEQIDQDTLISTTQFLDILHNDQPLVSLVLCGDETLSVRLDEPVFRPLVKDLLLSYELNPMTREQLQAYARACLPGLNIGSFEIRNGVLETLYKESRGLPGAVP